MKSVSSLEPHKIVTAKKLPECPASMFQDKRFKTLSAYFLRRMTKTLTVIEAPNAPKP